jgi:hypothetical protein
MSSTPFPAVEGLENLEHHFRGLAKAGDDADGLLKAIGPNSTSSTRSAQHRKATAGALVDFHCALTTVRIVAC